MLSDPKLMQLAFALRFVVNLIVLFIVIGHPVGIGFPRTPYVLKSVMFANISCAFVLTLYCAKL